MDIEQTVGVAEDRSPPPVVNGSATEPGPPPSPPPPRPPRSDGWSADEPREGGALERRRRFLPRSLTWRLVTGVVALVAVLVVATGVATYYELRSSLYGRLEQQLQSTATSATSIRDLFSSDGQAGSVGVRAPQHVWAIALDPAGNELLAPQSPSVETMHLDPSDRRMLAARSAAGSVHVVTTDGQDLQVTVRQLELSNGQVASIVVVGLSTDEIETTLDKLLNLELFIGASAVTLAFVATAAGVRFSLRRLYGVTRTAREVAAELSPEGAGLDRRVPVPEPGTEVGQLAVSMNTLLSAVETQFAARLDSERRMRQFMADASHELRTPLTSIRGYAELARMQRTLGTGGDTDDTADNLRRIESEGTRMSRLVDDLLTLARSDQGSLPEIEAVDVSELLDDVVTSSRAAFPDRQIEFADGIDLTVFGDRDQLLRAVRNLVSNAATHTRPDGPIEVRASLSGPGVAIQVVDHGPGLPPEEAAHVFERFWRADKARTRARGGTGLGLAIVVSIVQMHGGTVHFHSTVEGGSTVTLWLPTTTA
ncbi:MAG: HAMP domain-containing sensor histidine kinase [Jatrophihabitantaceae bacterium]